MRLFELYKRIFVVAKSIYHGNTNIISGDYAPYDGAFPDSINTCVMSYGSDTCDQKKRVFNEYYDKSP